MPVEENVGLRDLFFKYTNASASGLQFGKFKVFERFRTPGNQGWAKVAMQFGSRASAPRFNVRLTALKITKALYTGCVSFVLPHHAFNYFKNPRVRRTSTHNDSSSSNILIYFRAYIPSGVLTAAECPATEFPIIHAAFLFFAYIWKLFA